MGSVLDVACGPGYHARAFARRGMRAVGLDLRPEMVELARDRARAEGVACEWLAADMRSFRLETPVDMAVCMFDGIDALLTNEDIVRHFKTVAANLAPEGLYLIELTHPRDSSFNDYGTFRYAGERDGIAVDIVWATNRPVYDPVTGVAQVEIELTVGDHGQRQTIRDTAHERLLSPQELGLLAQSAEDMRVVGWYGDFDLGRPLDGSAASRRAIAVLKREG